MKFKIGDKVAVIDDVFKGIVSEVSSHKIVMEDQDGFIFEFSPHELVIIKEDQADLSKYSDLVNENLIEKNDSIHHVKTPKFKSEINPKDRPPMEVDLHIQHLVPSSKGMGNFDILNLQVDTAKRQLEFAIRKRIPKIVFIHGVGAGVLKTELEYLFAKYAVEHYPASYRKYGLGATEVYIYQNPGNSL